MSLTIPAASATLEDEQLFFEAVRDVRESTRETRALAWQSAANGKDRARLKANAATDATLGASDEPVAFLRLDLDDGDTYYVGEHGVSDADNERVVLSWKAPAILRLRGASHHDRRGVARQRNYRTEPINRIRDIDDVVLAELARQVAELRTSDAQIVSSDTFLQSELARTRSPEMQTIVRTIQAAQADVIAAPHDTLLVVQGGPGTGKTAIALHRVAALLFGPLRDVTNNEVLVVGPNATFLKYISRVLPELGEENVVQRDIGHLMATTVTPDVVERPAAARLKGDARMVEVLARALSDRIRPLRESVEFTFDDVSWRVTLTPQDVAEIIDEVDRTPYAVGRARFRELLESEIATDARRRQKADGRWTNRSATPRPRPTDVESLVERVWPQLTPAAFLRDLFGSVERLLSAAGSTLGADEVGLLRRQAAPKLSEQQWSKEDLPLLDHVAIEMTGEAETYAHIVVDEVQDLSPMQLLALRRRSRHGAMTIVGDIAQSTGHWARDSWTDIVDLLASPLPTRRVDLEYGYRVPRAVMELAARLLPEAAPGIVAPTIVRDVENATRLHPVGTADDQFARAVEVVREHSSKGLFVGVVCPDGGRNRLEDAFRDARIQWNDADKGGLASAINVVSPGASKGLEFDAVVVVDPETIVQAGPHGLRMLYIALTRTTGYLDVVHVAGSLPRLLAEGGATQEPARVSPTSASGADGPTEAAPALPDVPVPARTESPTAQDEDRPDASAARARPRSRGGSVRERTVALNAENVLELLAEVAPAHLWQEILEEVAARIADES
ncbi:AAA family ATPase [Cellulomonas sp. zg-ZUI199]|uniref:AAA family ATPase n=1 Tax=Cellulomonas wangleii TaxID=2816956 RepID=A0ABX8D3P4_9CELL|nr:MULTISPECIES: AAA family ATPase [Cellulomonas]MBO0898945.1 AAA family ATPase [Cellulomonas sp. zg-ZUI22]MBO0923768.1 AAA family ATPase [Cellulomonas wangleii]MBO0924050.1 AAA family ATPase [Cellulomonas wangleii]QVI62076.1 AAA family ATPase [Cellulomonas wangleii]